MDHDLVHSQTISHRDSDVVVYRFGLFWLMHIAPGGPFDMERPMPEVVRANIEAKFHLDEPFLVQFWIYITNFAQGDLGPSFVYQDFTVTQLVAQS